MRNQKKNQESHELSQGAVIEQVLNEVERAKESGKFSDIFLTAPTGSGKSILFQIPAIYLARNLNYVTIVISPLKALMFDQVEALREQGIEEVAYLNSDQNLVEREEILSDIKSGKISILYLSPELLLSYQLDYFLGDRKLGLLVVDESHLVTTWGRDFRVDYWFLGMYLQNIRRYSEDSFPILALTATAVYGGDHDIVFETIGSLNMQLPRTYIGNIRREAIGFDVKALEFEGSHDEAKMKQTAAMVTQFVESGTKALVYFPWTSQIRNLFVLLEPEVQRRTGKYYGSMRADDRQEVAQGFKEGELLVVLATKAFGMGIDISDITNVYHHAPSGNLSDYVQEIGRVARDKSLKGLAQTDYSTKDLKYSRILFGLSSIKQWQVKEVVRKIHQMYLLKKDQSFLVSVEDFAFVFSATDDLEQKVKSSLLLVEKDFQNRYGYPVILTRPKSLFTSVFARFSPEVEAVLKSRYGSDMKLLKAGNPSVMAGIPMRPGMKRPDQSYSVYELDLDAIWSKHFKEKSFPDAKKAFFDKALFPDVAKEVFPQMRFSIGLLQDRETSYQQFQKYLTALDWTVGKLGEGFFLRQEMESTLNEQLDNPRMSRRLMDLLKALYSSKKAVNRRGRITMQETDTFLQIKRKPGGEDSYRVAEASYRQVRTEIDRKFQTFFKGDKTQYEKFITTNPQKSKRTLKLAYILEVMELGTYDVVGGRLPQLYLRINDPDKLHEATMSDSFNNLLVKQIAAQHDSSQKILDQFFTSDLTPEARWDFVEEYFLGGEVLKKEEV